MEFWGTEVGPGKPQVNSPGEDTYCHVSQAALGPGKDGKPERVVIRVETGGKNVVLGTLVSGKVDQMSLDLIFDRDFTLSHTSTSSSVFFCGYKTEKGGEEEYTSGDESDEEEDEDDDEEEEIPESVPIKENGTASAKEVVKAKQGKASGESAVGGANQSPKAKAKKVAQHKSEPLKPDLVDDEAMEGEDTDSDEDFDEGLEEEEPAMFPMVKFEFDSDEHDEDDSDFEEDDLGSEEEDEDSDEDDDEEDDEDSDDDEDAEDDDSEDDNADVEEMAVELGKKRHMKGSEKKSPAGGKKARLDTPAKPGLQTAAEYWESLINADRKGLIPSTPGKKAGAKGTVAAKLAPVSSGKKSENKDNPPKTPQKTPAKDTPVKTPKTTPGGDSGKKLGAHHCAECKRNFTTESALSQHSAAKHKK